MLASEVHELGKRAYSGDDEARRAWFARLAPLAIVAAMPYGVLPSLLLSKAATESGYGSDLYEIAFYEAEFGISMGRKAQRHNNLLGMNAFADNMQYLPSLPKPRWAGYKATFRDYGPHYRNGKIEMIAGEPWKHFESVEDCLEDFCANIRWQAQKNHKVWGKTIEEQLLAIESYTPEGAVAKTPGMHFEWQDTILHLYQTYGLWAYDEEAYKMSVKITTKVLDEHIKQAYAFARSGCRYGRTDTSYPPGEPTSPGEKGVIDCVGLVYRAFYTMGRFPRMMNIDQVAELCAGVGMVRSEDPADVWKHHGVVCMQDKNNIGTQHINHVYYSLGGSSASSISKYDLGSDDRIQRIQPFGGVPVNEWADRRIFLCMYYFPDKYEDVPEFRSEYPIYAKVVTGCGIYAGPGTMYRKRNVLKTGDAVLVHGIATNKAGNNWKAVQVLTGAGLGLFGYIGAKAAAAQSFKAYDGAVTGTDGSLSLRVGAGVECDKVADIPEGEGVYVDGEAIAGNGEKWLHVRFGKKLRGFVFAKYVTRK